jgi:hypothetical protein
VSDLPHPDECEWCHACAVETGGVVALCLDHQYERDAGRLPEFVSPRERTRRVFRGEVN